jgi:protein-L-isoaspartate O-methyltransferase
LPFISRQHPRHKEWLQRQQSCRRLVRYLALQKKSVNILEVGCGNGWLASQLSTIPGSRVIGLDPDYLELTQAARVFRRQPNLKFIYGDPHTGILQGLHFDIIVVAGLAELAMSPGKIIDILLEFLAAGGEIHLLDTRMQRLHELVKFPHRYLYNPRSVWNRIFHKNDPHPWICVKHP